MGSAEVVAETCSVGGVCWKMPLSRDQRQKLQSCSCPIPSESTTSWFNSADLNAKRDTANAYAGQCRFTRYPGEKSAQRVAIRDKGRNGRGSGDEDDVVGLFVRSLLVRLRLHLRAGIVSAIAHVCVNKGVKARPCGKGAMVS